MEREETFQQAVPAGAGGVSRVIGLAAGLITLLAVTLNICVGPCHVTNWWPEIGALLLVASTSGYFAWHSSPFRAPFRRVDHIVVIALAFLSYVFDELAEIGSNAVIHDDWGLFVIALYLLAMAMLRPVHELLTVGLSVTLGVGVVAAVLSPTFERPMTPVARAVVAMTLVLPAVAASTTFADRALRRLRATAAPASVANDAGEVLEARLSAQHENIAQLESEVVPLINRIIAERRITPADVERAREVATNLRAALVAGLAGSWLSELGLEVHDPRGYAETMPREHRTAVRALVASLPSEHPGARIALFLDGQDETATLELIAQLPERADRAALAPAMQLFRTVFSNATQRLVDHAIIIRAEFRVDRADGLR